MDIELQKIVEVYNSLLLAVEKGELEVSNALIALSNLSAIDATGAEWVMDPSGNWLRGFPGGPKNPANPDFFVSTAGREQGFNQNPTPQYPAKNNTDFSIPSNIPQENSYPQSRGDGGRDFINNIDSFNNEFTSPTKKPEHVESTFTFATKLIKTKFNPKGKIGALLKNRTLLILLVSVVIILVALYSNSKNKDVTNIVKNDAIVVEKTSQKPDVEIDIESKFLNELRTGSVTSFTHLEDNAYADLIGLAMLDNKFELSSLAKKDKIITFTLIFTLKDEMVSKKITLKKEIKGWSVAL